MHLSAGILESLIKILKDGNKLKGGVAYLMLLNQRCRMIPVWWLAPHCQFFNQNYQHPGPFEEYYARPFK